MPLFGLLAPPPTPTLFRQPTLNQTDIVFSHAGDLWRVPKAGGAAVRLTSNPGVEDSPIFSPDGKTIAFSGQYDGNVDVFTIPATGGVPKRLTAHPAPDRPVAWSRDGKSVVFSSNILSQNFVPRLFTVSVGGSFPTPLPFPTGTMASFSPDGQRIAYVPGDKWQPGWKRYRGGQTYPIWIGDLKDSRVREIPRENSNDEQPLWIGDRVYYISDKTGNMTLYSYDVRNNSVRQELAPQTYDIKSIQSFGEEIVFERFGTIHRFDTKTQTATPVNITVTGDFPEVRVQFKNAAELINSLSISPTGARVAVAARGYLFTIPADKGDEKLLTEKGGIHRQGAAWSPDSKTIAYLTDERGGMQLAVYDVATGGERILPLGDAPAYYSTLRWSPDSTRIAYTDNKKNLWLLDVRSGVNTRVDTGLYEDPNTNIVPSWSSDSKWLTWARDLENHLNAVFVYDVTKGVRTQITDGLANAKSPVFDRSGRHLYFFASTNTGWAASYLDLSSFNQPNVTSSVYAIVLRKDDPNPLAPESDEEPIAKAGDDEEEEEESGPPDRATKIDFEGIAQRTIALPMPSAAYTELAAGPRGSFFALYRGPVFSALSFPPPATLVKFDLEDREATPFGSGIEMMQVSARGDKILLMTRGGNVRIAPTAQPTPPMVGLLDTESMPVKMDPRVEWRQIFEEVCRNQRIFFYDPGLHGVNMTELRAKYEPFLAGVHSRGDLTYLLEELVGELSIGHMWVSGGDIPGAGFTPGGLLGADFIFENGRYKITRVYDGESWNPNLRGPLAGPGVNAKAGEYLISIDGKRVDDTIDLYVFLEGKAGKQVRVTLGPTPDGKDSRTVTVVPTQSEFGLRTYAWIEDNRRYVEKRTNGRGAYVFVPDTAQGGWQAFQRYYYAQTGKDGAVIDERFNNGGLINDYMINEMNRTIQGVFTPRNGKDWTTPGVGIFGPKVMLINQYAGSGGDMFPWLFRHNKIGPLIGKRTWGGLVRSFAFPTVDGGSVNSPDVAFYNPFNNTWDVENYGVDPDIEVELDPYLWRQGKDAQLERAIDELNKRLATYKPMPLKRPASPDKTKVGVRH